MDIAVLTRLIEEGLPFHKLLGIRAASVEEGRVRLFIPFREDLIGDPRRPALHGGVISTQSSTLLVEGVYSKRARENTRQKNALAKAAVPLIVSALKIS